MRLTHELQAGLQAECDICTFRNNLNKVFMTPLAPSDDWTVDACLLGSTLYLDIQKGPPATYADSDLFEYYGYKYACSDPQRR